MPARLSPTTELIEVRAVDGNPSSNNDSYSDRPREGIEYCVRVPSRQQPMPRYRPYRQVWDSGYGSNPKNIPVEGVIEKAAIPLLAQPGCHTGPSSEALIVLHNKNALHAAAWRCKLASEWAVSERTNLVDLASSLLSCSLYALLS